MGGQTTQQTQQIQQTQPWAPASSALQGILANVGTVNPQLTGIEQDALAQLTSLGQRGNPFAPQIGGVTNTLLQGGGPDRAGLVNDAYSRYRAQLDPYLETSFLDPHNTPGFGDAVSALNSDITNQINSQFAAAGRDLSGLNTQTLARGLAQGEGQLIANQYNQNAARQLESANNLFSAGGQTSGLLSGLDQTRLANMQAGIGAADAATAAQQYGPLLELQTEAQRRGIPLRAKRSPPRWGLHCRPVRRSHHRRGKTRPPPLIGGAIGGVGLLSALGGFGQNGLLNFGNRARNS
jgi:hypothetical protein